MVCDPTGIECIILFCAHETIPDAPMTVPEFSVVIPYYNRPELLIRAVDSVLSQSFQDREILVVDDASTLPVPHFSEEVQVIRREANGGGAAARNDGIRAARGNFICFLDSDDYWLPTRLEDAFSFISRDKFERHTIFFEDVLVKKVNSIKLSHRNQLTPGKSLSRHILCHGLIQTSTLIVPNDGNLFFDDRLRLFQDLDYLIGAEKAKYRLKKIPSNNVIWDLVGDANRLSRKENQAAVALFLEKHGNFLSPRVREAFVLQNVDYWRRNRSNFLNFTRKTLFSDLAWKRKARLLLR